MTDRPVLEPTADHPITVEPTGKHVTVRVNGELVADTNDALTLQEATYPAVQYVPLRDVVAERLKASDTETYCPFKGDASYYHVVTEGGATVDDAIGDRGTQLDYRDAVHDYAAAFDVAEADAIRRRRKDFSAEGQQRLERAASAACGVRRRSDPTRTPARLRQGAPRARWADGVARHHARRNRAPDRRGDRGLTAASRPESRRVDQRYR